MIVVHPRCVKCGHTLTVAYPATHPLPAAASGNCLKCGGRLTTEKKP